MADVIQATGDSTMPTPPPDAKLIAQNPMTENQFNNAYQKMLPTGGEQYLPAVEGFGSDRPCDPGQMQGCGEFNPVQMQVQQELMEDERRVQQDERLLAEMRFSGYQPPMNRQDYPFQGKDGPNYGTPEENGGGGFDGPGAAQSGGGGFDGPGAAQSGGGGFDSPGAAQSGGGGFENPGQYGTQSSGFDSPESTQSGGSGAESQYGTQYEAGGVNPQTGNPNNPECPYPQQEQTPGVPQDVQTTASQIDQEVSTGQIATALNTLNSAQERWQTQEPSDSQTNTQDLMTLLENNQTSTGLSGNTVIEQLGVADVSALFPAYSYDGHNVTAASLITDASVAPDPVSKALVGGAAQWFMQSNITGPVQNDVLIQAELQMGAQDQASFDAGAGSSMQ